MLSLQSEAEDFPLSSAQARPTTPSAARSKVPSALGEAVHRQLTRTFVCTLRGVATRRGCGFK